MRATSRSAVSDALRARRDGSQQLISAVKAALSALAGVGGATAGLSPSDVLELRAQLQSFLAGQAAAETGGSSANFRARVPCRSLRLLTKVLHGTEDAAVFFRQWLLELQDSGANASEAERLDEIEVHVELCALSRGRTALSHADAAISAATKMAKGGVQDTASFLLCLQSASVRATQFFAVVNVCAVLHSYILLSAFNTRSPRSL